MKVSSVHALKIFVCILSVFIKNIIWKLINFLSDYGTWKNPEEISVWVSAGMSGGISAWITERHQAKFSGQIHEQILGGSHESFSKETLLDISRWIFRDIP